MNSASKIEIRSESRWDYMVPFWTRPVQEIAHNQPIAGWARAHLAHEQAIPFHIGTGFFLSFTAVLFYPSKYLFYALW